ncbi:MAG: class II aldolase/adducin family protein [Syntrophorhabdaceae bacterium]|nr:class II aldolase/adducin family protein [Syntrophorhabdaceae bacterium]
MRRFYLSPLVFFLVLSILAPGIIYAQAKDRDDKSQIQSTAGGVLRNEAIRQKLEQAHRIIYMMGLAEDSTRGHITVKSEDGLYYIKPWGTAFEKVTAKEMQGLDIDGNLIDGKGRMHSEKYLHLEIYRARKDVGSVIHVHPYYSILLSTVFDGKLSMIAQQSVPFMGKIPMFISPELIQTKQLGEAVAKALGDAPVLLMKNHGITVVGRTLEEAVVLAVHFEQAAKYHIQAHQLGKPSGMDPGDAQKLYKNNYRPDQIKMVWDYWLEKYNESKGK